MLARLPLPVSPPMCEGAEGQVERRQQQQGQGLGGGAQLVRRARGEERRGAGGQEEEEEEEGGRQGIHVRRAQDAVERRRSNSNRDGNDNGSGSGERRSGQDPGDSLSARSLRPGPFHSC
eukprot:scaffold833_cov259-Prasinococcus_capsulatus_cf.AAC.5